MSNVKRTPRRARSNRSRQPRQPSTPVVVTDPARLSEALEPLRRAQRFAFDTEFVMEDSYQAEVCLIQAATESTVVLLDPLAGVDDTAFWELVADSGIEKIVHAGAEDLGLCFLRTGRVPRNVFDLQVAAGLVGMDYPMSLLKLVRATCGARLHKSQTLTDWRRRPLTDAQMSYAIEDVTYLAAAHRVIRGKLEKLGRCGWLREELERFEQAQTYERRDEDQVFRLKGAGNLGQRSLAVAMELVRFREQLARQFNRPARALLKDHLIVEIARQGWSEPEQIRGLRGIQLSKAQVGRLAEAVRRGIASGPATWPAASTTREDTPHEAAMTALASALVRAYCHDHEIAHQLAATKQDLRDLVHAFSRGVSTDGARLFNGWRAETVGRELRSFFSGETRVAIRRKGGSVRPVVE